MITTGQLPLAEMLTLEPIGASDVAVSTSNVSIFNFDVVWYVASAPPNAI